MKAETLGTESPPSSFFFKVKTYVDTMEKPFKQEPDHLLSITGSDLSQIKGFCYIISSSQKQPWLNAQFVLPTVFRQIQLLYSHLGGKLHCWAVI